MKIGAMNHPTKDPVAEIRWLAANGFDCIDFTYEPFSYTLDLKEIKKVLEQSKLEIVGHTNPSLPAIYPLAAISRAAGGELKKSFEALAFLGAKKINIHPFLNAPHQTDEEKIEANRRLLKYANKICQGLRVTLMLENFYAPFNDPQLLKQILNEIPGLKMHLDIGHCNIESKASQVVPEFFRIFGRDIIHLHLHDNKGHRDDHLPIGCGMVDWPEIIKVIKLNGYDNTVTIEVFCSDRDYLKLSKEKILKLWNKV